MKSGVFIVTVLATVFFIALASANDAAYIYRKEFKIDQNFIDFFENMGFNVELINEKNVPADLSHYDFVFIGDEHFKMIDELPIEESNVVVANYFHGTKLGLVDRDGVSQMGSTSPLKIRRGGADIEVYTQAFIRGRIAVPYYYLESLNKLSEVEGFASTMRTSSGKNFGEVVAFLDKPNGAKTCFFGIVKSDFWTDAAKNLLKDCVDFVVGGEAQEEFECEVDLDCGEDSNSEPFCFGSELVEEVSSNMCVEGSCVTDSVTNLVEECEFGCFEGECLPEPAECEVDSDCPADEFSAPFCQEGGGFGDENVYQDETTYSCVESSCVPDTKNVLLDDCSFGCFEGECLPETPSEEVHDVGFVDFSNSFGMIRLEKTDGTDILEGESLFCGENYKVSVTLENKGGFVEDISFSGSVGSVLFNHNPISGHEPDVKKLKTKTIEFALEEGAYNVMVEASIDGFSDSNPLDNLVSREVFVECPAG